MTCREAKSLSIVTICERLGAKRVSVNRSKGYALYHCPYREDRHPSLIVNLKTNRWRDLATKQHGDVVDLVALTLSLSIVEALNFLSDGSDNIIPSVIESTGKKKKNCYAEVTIKPLTHPVLLAYVKLRGISPAIAKKYCYEAHKLSTKGRNYYTLAFPSLSGGYELRNSGYKGCCGRKDISIVGAGPHFLFFEGFIDFLSYTQIYDYAVGCTYVVLNSTANVGRAIDLFDDIPIRSIELWLDNDTAGRCAARLFIQKWPFAVDKSYLYSLHNDLNDYLCSIKDNH